MENRADKVDQPRFVGTSKLSTELDENCPLDELNARVIGLFVGHVSAHICIVYV